MLNNTYIQETVKDKEMFDVILKQYNITENDLKAFVRSDKYNTHRTDKEYLDIFEQIRKSYDKCITTMINHTDMVRLIIFEAMLKE